jgi:hypothetical protein
MLSPSFVRCPICSLPHCHSDVATSPTVGSSICAPFYRAVAELVDPNMEPYTELLRNLHAWLPGEEPSPDEPNLRGEQSGSPKHNVEPVRSDGSARRASIQKATSLCAGPMNASSEAAGCRTDVSLGDDNSSRSHHQGSGRAEDSGRTEDASGRAEDFSGRGEDSGRVDSEGNPLSHREESFLLDRADEISRNSEALSEPDSGSGALSQADAASTTSTELGSRRSTSSRDAPTGHAGSITSEATPDGNDVLSALSSTAIVRVKRLTQEAASLSNGNLDASTSDALSPEASRRAARTSKGSSIKMGDSGRRNGPGSARGPSRYNGSRVCVCAVCRMSSHTKSHTIPPL